ncbi:MAG: leucine-rich repeat domain-containing protein, partial [Treponema sp.]|nr:leucine-rich repeat domain-containing protein [Treponema sp.]
ETSSTPLVKLNDFDNKNSTIALTIPNCDSVEGIKIVEKNDNETSNITAIVGYEETEYVIGDGEDAPLVNPSIFDRDLLEAELLKTGQTLDTVASFTVPSNYKIIADETFKELTNLKTVVLLSGLTEIRSYAFTDCEKLSSVNIPDTVVNIGQSAFQNCTSLTSVSIPGSIVNLSDNIFSGCSALANVTLSEGISTLGYASFAQCTSLTGITLPESLAAINNSAFSGSGLTEVTIPSDVSSIMGWAFSNCESLTRVTFTAALASDGYGTSVFDSCNSSLKIYVPSEAESTFKTKWSDYATFIYTAIPISTASEYKAAVAVINSGNYNQNIILTKNIDLSGETESYVICTTFENPYTGTFNGNGKTLTVSKACGTFYPPYENHNGNMNTTSDNTEAFFAGIVGFIGEAGIVENVIVKSNDFDSEVSGIQHLGGIAYGNMGTIRNCENDISFTCSTYGNIGGICTENYGTIVNCINKGDISNNLINLNWAGRWEMAGGIAAGNGVDCDSSEGCGIFTSPANEETVSSLKGSIINCVNLGTVTTKNSDEDNDINGVPGAIAGFNGEGNKISNCYYKKDSVVKGSNTTSYPAYRPTTYTGVIQGTIEYCATMSDTITLFATITAGTESDCGVEQIIYKSKSYLNDALNAYVTDNNSDGKLKSWKKVTTDIGLSY